MLSSATFKIFCFALENDKQCDNGNDTAQTFDICSSSDAWHILQETSTDVAIIDSLRSVVDVVWNKMLMLWCKFSILESDVSHLYTTIHSFLTLQALIYDIIYLWLWCCNYYLFICDGPSDEKF